MSFNSYPFTDKKKEKWEAEGRGQGVGATWIPWLIECDVPSTHGHMERFVCSKSKRKSLCFSTGELHARMYFDARACVLGVEEQFPLDREKTRRIARTLRIEHPRDPKSRVDIVMTTDLVVRVRDPLKGLVWLPRSCKTHASIIDYNDAEHAEIERIYWAEEGHQWKVITDSERCVPPSLLVNLHTIKGYRFEPEGQAFEGEFGRKCDGLLAALALNSDDISLGEFCARYGTDKGLDTGEASAAALFLAHKERLPVVLAGPPIMRQSAREIARVLATGQYEQLRRAA